MTSPRSVLKAYPLARTTTLAAAVLVLCAAAPLIPGVGAATPSAPQLSNQLAARLSAATTLLARPNGGASHFGPNLTWSGPEARKAGSPVCSANVCVHWTQTGSDAPPTTDADSNGIPDQVDQTLAAADTSWSTIVGTLEFRAPLPDTRASHDGGDGRYDIYLADTGAQKLSGYTSSDDPRLAKDSKYRFRDVSAFSVVDNDFSSAQFSHGTPTDNMRVTVAHELMHASEYAYDYREDAWLTEGTAAWVESQVFSGVHLNVNFLSHSALTNPLEPVDFGKNGYQYGAWIFLQYLSERFGPKIVSRIWHFADDGAHQLSPKQNKTYSMVAVRRALPKKAPSLSTVFATFARDNAMPASRYSSGALYPHATPVHFTLDRKHRTTHWQGIPLNHMSAIHVSVSPGKGAPLHGRLRIATDGPDRKFDPQFRVTVVSKSGHLSDHTVRLNKHGNGKLRVPFGRKSVSSVDITLVNADPTMRACYQRKTPYSCSGRGVDGRILQVKATL